MGRRGGDHGALGSLAPCRPAPADGTARPDPRGTRKGPPILDCSLHARRSAPCPAVGKVPGHILALDPRTRSTAQRATGPADGSGAHHGAARRSVGCRICTERASEGWQRKAPRLRGSRSPGPGAPSRAGVAAAWRAVRGGPAKRGMDARDQCVGGAAPAKIRAAPQNPARRRAPKCYLTPSWELPSVLLAVGHGVHALGSPTTTVMRSPTWAVTQWGLLLCVLRYGSGVEKVGLFFFFI